MRQNYEYRYNQVSHVNRTILSCICYIL
ncbi:Protein CBG27006 [Caenorhabditis briggsae]|uniref:Protein CBG27006 n=1 Tax=Caenorhabditis briggsae TaxID=6238 RepID=B6IH62_CAEBR|nr:Protein CBG27006 [Caenorhabditis briggsae]CAR99242.1 Protein CBG27006 [Caenorhabditis briggsae]